jgi:hypothetical protein
LESLLCKKLFLFPKLLFLLAPRLGFCHERPLPRSYRVFLKNNFSKIKSGEVKLNQINPLGIRQLLNLIKCIKTISKKTQNKRFDYIFSLVHRARNSHFTRRSIIVTSHVILAISTVILFFR